MSTYHGTGISWLCCPTLADLDERYKRHPDKHPGCARGRECILEHEHEPPLPEPAGHGGAVFYWWPGCRPPALDEPGNPMPRCNCGRWLVWADLDNLYAPEHLIP